MGRLGGAGPRAHFCQSRWPIFVLAFRQAFRESAKRKRFVFLEAVAAGASNFGTPSLQRAPVTQQAAGGGRAVVRLPVRRQALDEKLPCPRCRCRHPLPGGRNTRDLLQRRKPYICDRKK